MVMKEYKMYKDKLNQHDKISLPLITTAPEEKTLTRNNSSYKCCTPVELPMV